MRFITLFVCGLMAAMGSASAQNSFSNSSATDYMALVDASYSVHAGCVVASREETPNFDATEACACFTGFLGGKLTQRQFDILGYIMDAAVAESSGASDAEIQSIVMEMKSKGYSLEELQEVLSVLDQVTKYGDAVCAPFQEELISQGRTS